MATSIGEIEATLRFRDEMSDQVRKAQSSVEGLGETLHTLGTGLKQFSDGFERAKDSLDIIGNAATAVTDKLGEIGTKLTTRVTLPLAGFAGGALKAAIDFESAFSGVKRTVEGVSGPLGELTPLGERIQQSFRDLAKEIPISASELAKIGEIGGQLGVQTSEITKFTKTIALIGATTSLSTEEAATGIAQLGNIMKTAGVAVEFDRIGSTLSLLGDKSSATEGQILNMSTRLAAAGKLAGLSTADVLAFSTAMASVGVEAEAGGTAMSTVFQRIYEAVQTGNENLGVFASTAGMTSEQFKTAFGKDAAGATIAFIQGLQGIVAANGNVFETLKDVEFQDARVKRALLSTAAAGALLTETLGLSREEWAANAKLQAEAAIKFQTTESLMKLLWNRITDVAITIGNSLQPAFKSALSIIETLLAPVRVLADLFGMLPGPIQLLAIGALAAVAALGPLILVLKSLITTLAALSTLATLNSGLNLLAGNAAGATGVLGRLVTGLNPFVASATAAAGASGNLSTAFAAVGKWAGQLAIWVLNLIKPLFSLSNAWAVVTNAIGGTLGLLAKLGSAFVAVVGWPAILAAGFTLLALSIPQVRGVLGDLISIVFDGIAIFKDFAMMGIQAVVDWFKELFTTLSDIPGPVHDMVQAFLAIGKVLDYVKTKTGEAAKATKAYREELEAADKATPTLPGMPQGFGKGPVLEVASAQYALATSLGFTGSESDKAGQALTLLADRMISAKQGIGNLTDAQKTYITKAHAAGDSTDDISKALKGTVSDGVIAEYAKQMDEAGKKTDEAAKKMKELQDTLSGKTLIKDTKELGQAALGVGGFMSMTHDDAQKLGDSIGDVEKRFGSLNKAGLGFLNGFATEFHDARLTEGIIEVNKAMGDFVRDQNKTIDIKPLSDSVMAWSDNEEAIRASQRAVEDMAHSSSLGILSEQTEAVRVSFERQRASLTLAARGASNYGELVAQLSDEEAAARDKVTREWIAGGELTMAEMRLVADDARTRYAAIKESGEFSADAVFRAWEKSFNAQRALHKAWAESFRMVSVEVLNAVGEIAKIFTKGGEIGAWFQQLASGLDAAGKAGEGAAKGVSAMADGHLAEGAAMLASNIGAVARAFTDATSTGNTFQKTLSGALVGAQFGSAFGPIGAAIGAGIGGLGGLLKGLFGDDKKGVSKMINETFGGFDELHAKLKTLGAEGETLWMKISQGPARGSLEKAKGVVNEITAAFAAAEEHAKALSAAVTSFTEGAATRVAAFASNFDSASALLKENGGKMSDEVTKAFLDKLGGTQEDVQKEFGRVGLYAGTAFALQLRENGWAAAIRDAGPMFEQLLGLTTNFGLQLTGTAAVFASFYESAKANEDVLLALDGLTQMIRASGDALILNQDLFSAFGEDINTAFTRLTERGVEANQALVFMQPTLQALWEAQQKFGLVTDESTQAILDQAVAQGIVGQGMVDVNEKILFVLTAIADVLGATIPDALRNLQNTSVHIPVTLDAPNIPGVIEPGSATPDVPGFAQGTHGKYFNFGSGTLAMLHGREKITPEGEDGGGRGGVAIIEMDGRTIAEAIVPHLPDVVRRFGLV